MRFLRVCRDLALHQCLAGESSADTVKANAPPREVHGLGHHQDSLVTAQPRVKESGGRFEESCSFRAVLQLERRGALNPMTWIKTDGCQAPSEQGSEVSSTTREKSRHQITQSCCRPQIEVGFYLKCSVIYRKEEGA